METFYEYLSSIMANVEPTFIRFSNPYTPRTELEKELQYVRDRDDTFGEPYFIVVGLKGAGKTAIVGEVFKKPGTVVVSITHSCTHESIIGTILQECMVGGDYKGLDVDDIREPLMRAWAKKKSPVNIIIEVNSCWDLHDTLATVKVTAKRLACYSTVVIVIAETNNALEFGFNREPRERFIWIDAMADAEALAHARAIGITTLTDTELAEYFTKVGTLPLQILLLKLDLDEGLSLNTIIDEAVANARASLSSFAFKKY